MAVRTIRVSVVVGGGAVANSSRMAAVCGEFGLLGGDGRRVICRDLGVRVGTGLVTVLVGPSGAGKSSVLRSIAEQCPGSRWVGADSVRREASLIDAVLPGRGVREAMEVLTACGLGEPRIWLQRVNELSEGERFRASLAVAIGRAMGAREPVVILCDDFAGLLHERVARAVAMNVRRLATRRGLAIVLATTREELLPDLLPDVVIRLHGESDSGTARGGSRLVDEAVVERGSVRDYSAFAGMHYRAGDGLGFVDKVFVMRERAGGAALGVVVYAMPPIELAARNAATAGRFACNPFRLNREVRILRRLVVHPDVRGCGFGHRLVRETLPSAGTRFVECLASMGAVNPALERAGMARVGVSGLPRGRMALLARMRGMKVDPFSEGLAGRIRRCPRVRRMVEQTIRDWRRATTGGGERRAIRCGAEELAARFRGLVGPRPVYYLWDREGEFPRGELERDAGRGAGDRHDPYLKRAGRGGE